MASNYFMLTLPEEGNENFLLEYMAAPVSVIENPPLPSDDKINPNMTLGEMMDKKVSPPGMVPTWTDAARKNMRRVFRRTLILTNSPLTLSIAEPKKITINKLTHISAQASDPQP